MRKKKFSSHNLKFATLFSLLVAGLILFSLILRLFFIVGASRFDGGNSLTILSDAKVKQVINFSPREKSISILTIETFKNPKEYEIPVEAKFRSEDVISSENISGVLSKKIFDFKDQKEINFMDFLRLFFYSNTVKDLNINENTISSDSSLQEVNKITSSFFIDPVILEEKLNIEVINATQTFGLGNRLGNLINNMGGNVILVTTGDLERQSRIEYVRDSYTIKRLSRLLKFKLVETKKKSIPDVIIVIGEDSLRGLRF